MQLNVAHKLFLTFLIASTLVIIGMAAFMTWSFERGFIDYIENRRQERIEGFITRLEDFYASEDSWQPLQSDIQIWFDLLFAEVVEEPDNPPRWVERLMQKSMSKDEPDGDKDDTRLDERMLLLSPEHEVLVGDRLNHKVYDEYPIRVNQTIVGYLAHLRGPPLESLIEARFLERQTANFIWIALAAVLLSAALALPLARRLVKPLRDFARGSEALAAGRYSTRMPVESEDEFGRLARDFNALAAALEKTEAQRRQWVADTSHELRTPLSVLRGELEALQDGMRPFDQQAVDSLHAEIMRMKRLVDDLYELSKSDIGSLSYREMVTDAAAILEDTLRHYEPEFNARNITTECHADNDAPQTLRADPDRLAQLFRNLLNNSLRYTDPGGRVRVATHGTNGELIIDFDDSAPGVTDAELEHLFERFYRVEASRNRESGGAGLGLAICRNIVEAHNGRIEAQHSPLGGVRVRITLPV